MTDPVVDMDFETKYGHLTKPLKEAAACWDIDLEEVMESFLAAQTEEGSSLDPSHMLNFAQAGMLVSSTATNYGRKVENLYTLVYSTLDTMSKGEGKSLASSALMKRMRKRIVGFQEFENGLELLDAQFNQPARGIDMADGDGMSNGAHITRRVPLLLLPREESGEKNAAGKDSNVASQSKQSANGTEYKTSSCWVSESGCLLLDPGFAVYEEKIISRRESLSGPLVPGAPTLIADELKLPDLSFQEEAHDLIPDDMTPPSPDFGDPSEAPEASPEPPMTPGAFPPLPSTNIELVVKRARDESQKEVLSGPGVISPHDAFAMLDPHSVPSNSRNLKPKYGRCHEALAEPKSVFDIDFASAGSKSIRAILFYPESSVAGDASGGKHNKQGLADLADWPFLRDMINVKCRDERRRVAQAARERRKEELRKANSLNEFLETSEDDAGGIRGSIPGAGRHSVYSNRHSVASFGHRDDDESRPLNSTEGQALMLQPTREQRAMEAERARIAGLENVLESTKHMYDELMKKKLAEMIAATEGDEPSGSQQGIGSQSVASLVAAAGNSVQDRIPELYANIRKWQDNLEPLLEEQTARPLFDLDDYLVSIIDKLKTSTVPEEETSAISAFLKSVGAEEGYDSSPTSKLAGPGASFEELVKGEPKWNVCRLFLSTLILTNNGNVEIFNETNETDDLSPTSAAVAATPAKAARTPAAKITPNALVAAGSPLRGSHTYGASHSFQVKLRNADKNLKFAIQDNASVVSGVIPIITNKDVPAPEPIGDVPFADDE